MAEDFFEIQRNVQFASHARQHLIREQRVATQLKEIVFSIDGVDLEDVFPAARQESFGSHLGAYVSGQCPEGRKIESVFEVETKGELSVDLSYDLGRPDRIAAAVEKRRVVAEIGMADRLGPKPCDRGLDVVRRQTRLDSTRTRSRFDPRSGAGPNAHLGHIS